MIKADPFSFRDFVQFILPTLIGVFLFSPYITPLDSIEVAFIYAALFSYVIATPISTLARTIYNLLPLVRQKVKSLKEKREWWAQNWNYDRLFYLLSKDEREYLYLSGSYTEFYRTASVYFFIYFLVQMGFMAQAICEALRKNASWWESVINQKTPMLGNWEFPTMMMAIISAVAFLFLFKDFLLEYEILFLDNGQYVTLAEKYHETVGRIATSVWGRVGDDAHPVANADVTLIAGGDHEIASTKTDKDGWFQLRGVYDHCLETPCRLRARKDGQQAEKEISQDSKVVPYVKFRELAKPIETPS